MSLVRPAPRAAPLSPPAAVARRLLFSALRHLRDGELVVREPGGATHRFGVPSPERRPIVLDVLDSRFYGRLARAGKLAVGEGYTAGEWRCDDLVGLIELFAAGGSDVFSRPPLGPLARLSRLAPRLPRLAGLGRAKRDIQAHYDLSNEFFALFLDPSMTYSCAYWDRPEATLEEAQAAKFRRLADGLAVGPGQHVLEIGTGWGAFALQLARERGCRVTTTTISRAQFDLASQRVHEAGLGAQVTVLERDYRTLEGCFDRIVSVEMLEAIGHRQFPVFFAAVDRLLAPGGLAGVQTIAIPDQRYDDYRRSPDWIRTHIFPGGLLPSVTALCQAMTSSSDLTLHGLEEIGLHYARTLREWRERFLANVRAVRALGFDEPFIRTWDFYLAFCQAAFASRALRDVQLVLARPGP